MRNFFFLNFLSLILFGKVMSTDPVMKINFDFFPKEFLIEQKHFDLLHSVALFLMGEPISLKFFAIEKDLLRLFDIIEIKPKPLDVLAEVFLQNYFAFAYLRPNLCDFN